ncbi:MAG: hypothetical protein QUS09_02210 [Methanotrichaceae archaeon]|nr:hypothetical protein [Methanotrichaceae archaeon]
MVLVTQASQDEPAELKNDTVGIQDILKDRTAYNGRMVMVEGTIVDECPLGCWFTLDDGTASIYVDIKASNFIIPQKRGSEAKVYGRVTIRDGDPIIIGKIVEIDGEVHR